jgi:hypothetical protein
MCRLAECPLSGMQHLVQAGMQHLREAEMPRLLPEKEM